MENKYYTPTIEEFHVGFEYEVISLESDLETCIIKHNNKTVTLTSDITGLYQDLGFHLIRVKYLDKEDIESLGFTHLPKKSLKGLTERFIIEGLHRRLNEEYDDTMWWNVYLEYSPDIKRIIIKGDISSGNYGEKFFEGNIKNKSELKVLLKQLGII